MATNTALLKSKMVLNNDTTIALAKCLGVNRQNISVKLNGRRDFKQSEIAKIIRRYNLTDDEIRAIFWDDYEFGEDVLVG
jgi:hypothetical protein